MLLRILFFCIVASSCLLTISTSPVLSQTGGPGIGEPTKFSWLISFSYPAIGVPAAVPAGETDVEITCKYSAQVTNLEDVYSIIATLTVKLYKWNQLDQSWDEITPFPNAGSNSVNEQIGPSETEQINFEGLIRLEPGLYQMAGSVSASKIVGKDLLADPKTIGPKYAYFTVVQEN